MTDASVRALADRLEIEQLMARYARALDVHSAEQIRALYPPRFIADYEPVSGVPAREVSSDAFARMVARGLGPLKTQHLIGSALIEIEGDEARGSFYAVVSHWCERPRCTDSYLQWGGYEVRFARHEGRWLIVRQRQYITHSVGDPRMLGLEDPAVQSLMREVFGQS